MSFWQEMSRAEGDLESLAKEYAEVETWADTARADRACRATFPSSVGKAAVVEIGRAHV